MFKKVCRRGAVDEDDGWFFDVLLCEEEDVEVLWIFVSVMAREEERMRLTFSLCTTLTRQ